MKNLFSLLIFLLFTGHVFSQKNIQVCDSTHMLYGELTYTVKYITFGNIPVTVHHYLHITTDSVFHYSTTLYDESTYNDFTRKAIAIKELDLQRVSITDKKEELEDNKKIYSLTFLCKNMGWLVAIDTYTLACHHNTINDYLFTIPFAIEKEARDMADKIRSIPSK